jgi:hypothetical protein
MQLSGHPFWYDHKVTACDGNFLQSEISQHHLYAVGFKLLFADVNDGAWN